MLLFLPKRVDGCVLPTCHMTHALRLLLLLAYEMWKNESKEKGEGMFKFQSCCSKARIFIAKY